MSKLIADSELLTEQSPLAPLPHPIYFVHNDAKLCEWLAQVTGVPSFASFYNPAMGASCSWIVNTYLQLKHRGLEVYLVPRYIPGRICIIARQGTTAKRLLLHLPFRSYVVACQTDGARPALCERCIVQNQLNITGPTDHFIHHWPQPDLQPRNPARGTTVENIAYKGRWLYMPESLTGDDFATQLSQRGYHLLSPDSTQAKHGAWEQWGDYTEADVVLGLRNYTSPAYLAVKPATKLINAWIAGCPALMGPEPAFQQLRQSELDYIEVRTPEEVIAALEQLRSQPKLYEAMVENGFRRAQEFTTERIVEQWRDLLAGPIAEGYEQWLQDSWVQKHCARPVQFVYRLFKQRCDRKRWDKLAWHTDPNAG